MLSFEVPYILTKELLPVIEQSDDPCIINTSSFMHHFANVKDLDFGLEKNYSATLAYNNAKLFTNWMTLYLSKIEAFNKVSMNSYHPGLISTNLGNDTSVANTKKSMFARVIKFFSKDLNEGIEKDYYLALAVEVKDMTGKYFDNKKQKLVSYKGYTDEKAEELITYLEAHK